MSTYTKVPHAGSVVDCAVLIAAGTKQGNSKRPAIGCSAWLSEAEVNCRPFLKCLGAGGMQGVEIVTSDDHSGLRSPSERACRGVASQRRQVHM